jgi:ribose transport system substrate-binding protein
VFIGTISYFPERYGTYLVPIIVDLLEGKEVPERIIPAVAPVTRENVMELYPGN